MIALISLLALLIGGAPLDAAAQQSSVDVASVRSRVAAKYEIFALRDGIGLRPKDRNSLIRIIEVSDGISRDSRCISLPRCCRASSRSRRSAGPRAAK